MTFRFEPPAAYGGIERFNASLAEWLGANTGSVATPKPDCVIDYALEFMHPPMMQDLRAFFRASFETFIASLPAMGLDRLLPPPPVAGALHEASVFIRKDGRNGEHVHPGGYLSGVYYVQVPQSVRVASDRRGCLVVGSCEKLSAGRRPSWGLRYIKPEEGMLVLFPSHLFHDVVPTGDTELRRVISMDLRPASPARQATETSARIASDLPDRGLSASTSRSPEGSWSFCAAPASRSRARR